MSYQTYDRDVQGQISKKVMHRKHDGSTLTFAQEKACFPNAIFLMTKAKSDFSTFCTEAIIKTTVILSLYLSRARAKKVRQTHKKSKGANL